jgi:translation initiation factor IF-2
MAAGKTIRLSKLAREFNVGIHTIVEFLHKKGFDYDTNPNTKISEDALALLEKEYKVDLNLKKESEKIILKSHRPKQEVISIDDKPIEEEDFEDEEEDFEEETPKTAPKKAPAPEVKKKEEVAPVEKPKPEDKIKVVGKVDLESLKRPAKKAEKTVPEKQKKEPEKENTQKVEKTEEPAKPAAKKEEKPEPVETPEVKEKPEKE